MAYGISTGELEMHTYDIVQADHGKLRAKTDGKTSTMERRIGSHSNPVSNYSLLYRNRKCRRLTRMRLSSEVAN